jgi:hypothetical protein
MTFLLLFTTSELVFRLPFTSSFLAYIDLLGKILVRLGVSWLRGKRVGVALGRVEFKKEARYVRIRRFANRESSAF